MRASHPGVAWASWTDDWGGAMHDLHIEESGPVEGPTIVFLHGNGNSGRMWAGHMDHFSSYHCLAPDLPGFGRSNHLPWESVTHAADAIADLIHTRVSARHANVVGLSLGGAIAHALLARHPGLLLRVVIDGAGVLPSAANRLASLGVAAMSPFLHTAPVMDGLAKAFGLDEGARADLMAASPRAFRRAFADASTMTICKDEVEASTPTLLVAGEKELKSVRVSNAALAHLMPAAEARCMCGRGHGWVGAEPELHMQMIEAWITHAPLPFDLQPETMRWPKEKVSRLLR